MKVREAAEMAAKLLKIEYDEATGWYSPIEDETAVYVSVPGKGGPSIIVSLDGSLLYADSSVSYSRHLEEYRKGTRTPIEAFNITE